MIKKLLVLGPIADFRWPSGNSNKLETVFTPLLLPHLCRFRIYIYYNKDAFQVLFMFFLILQGIFTFPIYGDGTAYEEN